MTPARRQADLDLVDAELAHARERRDTLLRLQRDAADTWGGGLPTAGGPSWSPEAIGVSIARVGVEIAALEDRREALAGVPAVPVPAPIPRLSATPANDTATAGAKPTQAEYLTTREAAALLGVSVKGLEALRARGEGPPFVRVGRAVRYRRQDLRPNG